MIYSRRYTLCLFTALCQCVIVGCVLLLSRCTTLQPEQVSGAGKNGAERWAGWIWRSKFAQPYDFILYAAWKLYVFSIGALEKGEIPSPNALSTCEILSPSVSWCLNMLGTLDIKLIICTFVITVGMLYNVCFGFFFCTQFGKQFVGLHFVFLGAHGSAVSLPLSPAGTFSCTCICYVWVIIGFTLCFV